MSPRALEAAETLLGVLHVAVTLPLASLLAVACGIYLGVLISLAVPVVVMAIYLSEYSIAIVLAN